MNALTDKLIRELADKLGTTADHLWAVLVKQSYIEGWCQVVGVSVVGIILLLAGLLVNRKTTVKNIEHNGITYMESDWDDYGVVAWGVFGIIVFIYAIISIAVISDSVSCFANPEYCALMKIVGGLE